MSLVFNAVVATVEMMGIFFCVFFVVYLVALFLSPIEEKLSRMVWEHSGHGVKGATPKPTFREFSQKHR